MRILVTGAGGYIGRHLIPRLREEGHEIVAQDSRGECAGDPPKGGGRWHFDWANPDQAYALRCLISPDTVIHLAGRVDINLLPNPLGAHLPPVPGPCDIGALYRDNVLATANVLQYCLQAGVKHLIFASTQAVYGWSECVSASTDPDPLEYYALSKLGAEAVLGLAEFQGLPVTILRLPGIYGGDRKSGAVYQMCRDALTTGQIKVTADYPVPCNVLHIEDAVAAFAQTVRLGDRTPREVNLSESSDSCSLTELAREIQEAVPGSEVTLVKCQQKSIWVDGSRAIFGLDWHPKPRKERLAQVLEEIRRDCPL